MQYDWERSGKAYYCDEKKGQNQVFGVYMKFSAFGRSLVMLTFVGITGGRASVRPGAREP